MKILLIRNLTMNPTPSCSTYHQLSPKHQKCHVVIPKRQRSQKCRIGASVAQSHGSFLRASKCLPPPPAAVARSRCISGTHRPSDAFGGAETAGLRSIHSSHMWKVARGRTSAGVASTIHARRGGQQRVGASAPRSRRATAHVPQLAGRRLVAYT